MKKLSLDLEQLAVESFATDAGRKPYGTVRGHVNSNTTCFQIICDCPTGGTCDTDCGQVTCGADCGSGNPSCADTCFCSNTCPANTCAYSCEGTCGCPTWSPNETCGIC
jgi:hypothetical protein